jgi:methylphosphotriester-DNA--protein-cysteine methyltransferase
MKIFKRVFAVALFLSAVFSGTVLSFAAESVQAVKKEVQKSEMFIADKNGTMYHRKYCPMLLKTKEADRVVYKSAAKAEAAGYAPCGLCVPEKN